MRIGSGAAFPRTGGSVNGGVVWEWGSRLDMDVSLNSTVFYFYKPSI